jgi:hypothetical protein
MNAAMEANGQKLAGDPLTPFENSQPVRSEDHVSQDMGYK